MNHRLLPIAFSLLLAGQSVGGAFAAEQPELNFKIYSPASNSQAAAGKTEKPAADPSSGSGDPDSIWGADSGSATQTPKTDAAAESATSPTAEKAPTPEVTPPAAAESTAAPTSDASAGDAPKEEKKVLQGYIRIVPSGTKIPIIMDTAVDSDTSQEGDEFAARTGEDLNIDGSTIVPAGSVIKGRLAALNAPRALNRSGSVALKFDTVTTPDNRQIPIVANLVARGGVVHARRGMKDIALDTGTVALPTVIGVGIGALAGGANSGTSGNGLGRAGGALVGAGVGAAVGIIVLCIKKGKKVDVRPGDELKIELAEDLRMPM